MLIVRERFLGDTPVEILRANAYTVRDGADRRHRDLRGRPVRGGRARPLSVPTRRASRHVTPGSGRDSRAWSTLRLAHARPPPHGGTRNQGRVRGRVLRDRARTGSGSRADDALVWGRALWVGYAIELDALGHAARSCAAARPAARTRRCRVRRRRRLAHRRRRSPHLARGSSTSTSRRRDDRTRSRCAACGSAWSVRTDAPAACPRARTSPSSGSTRPTACSASGRFEYDCRRFDFLRAGLRRGGLVGVSGDRAPRALTHISGYRGLGPHAPRLLATVAAPRTSSGQHRPDAAREDLSQPGPRLERVDLAREESTPRKWPRPTPARLEAQRMCAVLGVAPRSAPAGRSCSRRVRGHPPPAGRRRRRPRTGPRCGRAGRPRTPSCARSRYPDRPRGVLRVPVARVLGERAALRTVSRTTRAVVPFAISFVRNVTRTTTFWRVPSGVVSRYTQGVPGRIGQLGLSMRVVGLRRVQDHRFVVLRQAARPRSPG